MFGEEFGDCWHEIPGVSGLELSGDLRFRGPRVLRKLRHDCNGRPYVQARKVVTDHCAEQLNCSWPYNKVWTPPSRHSVTGRSGGGCGR